MKILTLLQDLVQKGQHIALVTVIGAQGSTPRKPGARMLVGTQGLLSGSVGGGSFEHRILSETLPLIQQGAGFHRLTFHLTRELAMCCGGEMEVTVEIFTPPTRLIIFGAGHVAQALAPLADTIGFSIYVLDDREDYATTNNFPQAQHIDTDIFAPRHSFPLKPDDICLVMTSDHGQDQAILEMILEGPNVAFIGLIGSQTKLSKFKTRFKSKGLSENKIDQIVCPVGLDIGAETPEEIAVSIVAQLIQIQKEKAST